MGEERRDSREKRRIQLQHPYTHHKPPVYLLPFQSLLLRKLNGSCCREPLLELTLSIHRVEQCVSCSLVVQPDTKRHQTRMSMLISDGREGAMMKLIASRLKQKGATDEDIEEIFNVFKIFPINDSYKLTAEAMKSYVADQSKTSGETFPLQQAENGFGALIGLNGPTKSIDFEQFFEAIKRIDDNENLSKVCVEQAVDTAGDETKLAMWAMQSLSPEHEKIHPQDVAGLVHSIGKNKL